MTLVDEPTQVRPPADHGPELGPVGLLRWAWRRLTSMRTALILLALLAIAAVPGTLLPQRGVATDPRAVARFAQENPDLAPVLDALGLFEVFAAPWFAAIYLLLLVSLTGCVLPRCLVLWRAWRSPPPMPPSRLEATSPGAVSWETSDTADEVVQRLAAQLRRRRFRVRVTRAAVGAETGHVRELGNLAFHLSLLVLLVGVALGNLYGFEGRVIVQEGAGFSNTRSQYDEFWPGPRTDEDRLTPFSMTLNDLAVRYETEGARRGEPRDFRADVTVTGSDGAERDTEIRVNSPLDVGGTKMFLTGNGYAPVVTVRDGLGDTVFSGPVTFLPLDGMNTSEGVIKAPDARPQQLGFEGVLLPTVSSSLETPLVSVFPDALAPVLVVTAWTGDLGMSDGAPQSVFQLDTSDLDQVEVDGEPLAEGLVVGQTVELPDGLGSITFDGVTRFANFQIASDPGKEISLVAAILLLVGLTVSLTVRRRRVLALVRDVGGHREVVVVSRGLTRLGPPAGELAAVTAAAGRPAPLPEPSPSGHEEPQ